MTDLLKSSKDVIYEMGLNTSNDDSSNQLNKILPES